MLAPKSMRPIEELIAEFNDGGDNLSPEEERLVDSVIFEKTGKRTSKFSKPAKRVEPMSVNRALTDAIADIPISSYTITKGPETDPKELKRL